MHMENNQNNEKRKESARVLTAKDGCLSSAFTLNKWFVKVKPCYAIGKVCFSFVLKKTEAERNNSDSKSGKQQNAFDIYIEMDEFDNWCDDILSVNHTLERRIENERKAQSAKPYYSITTGTKGAYTLKFCYSTVSDVNISGKGNHKENGVPVGQTLYANVPVSFSWLRTLAKYFKRTSKPWFDNISNIILESSTKRHDIYDDNYADENNTFDYENSQSQETQDASNNAKDDGMANNMPKAENSPNEANNASQSNASKDDSTNTTAKSELKRFTLYTASKPCERTAHKGDYSMQATEKPLVNGKIANDAHSFNVVVTHDIIEKLGSKWTEFLNKASDSSVKVVMHYVTGTEEIKGKTYNVVYLKNMEL